MKAMHSSRGLGWMLIGSALLTAVSLTGCQSNFGGQTLPSPYYMTDDVQYFPPGPEFKLAREAAAMKEAQAQAQQQQNLRR